jgi:hypothetical protein
MSLRKGTLEEYYNSGPVANNVCGKPQTPGQPRTCYQDEVEGNILDKLFSYRDWFSESIKK